MTSRVWRTLSAPGNDGNSASSDRAPGARWTGDRTFSPRAAAAANDDGDERRGSCDGVDRRASFMRRVEDWLATRPVAIVGALVADTHLSLRQVERNCKALYGLSPKQLARRARALRAAAAIHANPQDDYDVVEYGFYDQAHMIREIKKFTGMTPGQIRAGKHSRATAGRSVCAGDWAMSC